MIEHVSHAERRLPLKNEVGDMVKGAQNIHAIISADSCDRQSTVEDSARVSYECVTLAGGGFQPRTIEDGDEVPPMLDQTIQGERADRLVHAGKPNPEPVREKLLCQVQLVGRHPIAHHQEPPLRGAPCDAGSLRGRGSVRSRRRRRQAFERSVYVNDRIAQVKYPGYSQWEGRHELFDRRR